MYSHHSSAIWSIISSYDGRILVSAGSEDLKITQWKRYPNIERQSCGVWNPVDVDSREGRKCHLHFISGVFLFEMKGELLLATSDIGDDIYIWRFGCSSENAAAAPYLKFTGDLLWIGGMKTSFIEPIAIVLSPSMYIQIYSVETLDVVYKIETPALSRVDFCAVFVDRGIVAFSLYADETGPSSLQIWKLMAHSLVELVLDIQSSEPEKDTVSAITTVHDFLITGHADNKIRMWSISAILEVSTKVRVVNISSSKTPLMSIVLKGHTEPIYALAVWQHQRYDSLLISGSGDKSIRVWLICSDVKMGEKPRCLKILKGHSGFVYTLSVSTLLNSRGCNTPVLFSGGVDSVLMVWDLRSLLYTLNWKRRKHFCIFLCCCGLLNAQKRKKSKLSSTASIYRKFSLQLRSNSLSPKVTNQEDELLNVQTLKGDSILFDEAAEMLKINGIKIVNVENVFKQFYLCAHIAAFL